MKAAKFTLIVLTALLQIHPQQVHAGSVPFTSNDNNLEAAINSNLMPLDVLSNDDSGVANNDFKEVIGVCNIGSSDFECTADTFATTTGRVSINGSGNNNNVVFTSDANASTVFQFKYVMQNSVMATGSATAEVALTYIEVNNLSDTGSGGCDSSECTLREAMSFADADGESSVINFANDMTGTITLNNQLTVNSIDLSIIGPGADLVTVSGNDLNRVFWVPTGSERFFMSGLTISNGKTFVNESGAGILIENATDTRFENLRITNNDSINNGGGIYVSNAGLNLTNTEISLNAADNNGGGIAIEGGFGNDVTLENVTISTNQSGNTGDGVYINSNTGQNTQLRFVTSALNSGGTADNQIQGMGNVVIESSVFTPGLSIPNNNNVTNNSIVQSLVTGNINGSNNLSQTADLSLNPLAEINDSGLMGHSFEPISLAYNHVNDMVGSSGCDTTVTNDQFRNPRPTDGQCDAGAYEYIYIDVIFDNGFE